jgi:hypothetical protein
MAAQYCPACVIERENMTLPEILQRLGLDAQPRTQVEYVDQWLAVKAVAKLLADYEMSQRKTLFYHTFPAPKEGANTFDLADGRKIKATHKINRTILEDQIGAARQAYSELNDRPVDFEDLLKVKYDLVVAPFRKLEGPALLAVSRMVNAKDGAPDLKVE